MQNRDIAFTSDGKAILSKDTYEELRMFCRMHGETDLPAMGGIVENNRLYIVADGPSPEKIEYLKPQKEVKKLTDE